MASQLKNIRSLAMDWVAADAFFNGLPMVSEEMGDVVNLRDAALAKLGLGIIFLTPTARTKDWRIGGPFLNDVKLLVQVWEKPSLNKTNKAALEVAEQIAARLHKIVLDPDHQIVTYADPDTIQLGGDENYLMYDVLFTSAVQLASENPIEQVAAPVITQVDGNITLTTSTPGAAIYYTLDNTTPTPGNGTLYTGLFAPGAQLVLKARAGAWGKIASDIAVLKFTTGGGNGLAETFYILTPDGNRLTQP